MAVSYATYERVALEDGDGVWELVCGRLREKPGMTQDHNMRGRVLARQLTLQLPEDFQVGKNEPALYVNESTYYVPDVCAFPSDLQTSGPKQSSLEMYRDPLPFVAEVWSPSTGKADLETKVPAYQSRGDREIWRIHALEKEVIVWRRRQDGGYAETKYTGGIVRIESLPDVSIDLSRLFA